MADRIDGAGAARIRARGDVSVTPAADGVESDCERDELFMRRALELGESVRLRTSPNPWVGSVVVGSDGSPVGEGATAPPGGAHAEVAALRAAGGRASGSTLYTTLEPCAHHGRTPSCAEAIVQAGVARVVASVIDPDGHVNGRGMARLRAARVRVTTGVLEEKVESLLAPYLKHRRSGRPYVVLKLAATADGRIAARDGSSKWITGPEARADVQLLRRESDAVLVGARTIRMDDPMLTVRGRPGAGAGRPDEAGGQGGGAAERSGEATGQYAQAGRELLRVVLGRLPKDGARAAPALELSGDLRGVLDELGRRDILQVLVEGGAHVAGELHRAGLVDRYVIYMAPAFLGGDDGLGMFAGNGSAAMSELWRGRLVSLTRLADDVKMVIEPTDRSIRLTGSATAYQ